MDGTSSPLTHMPCMSPAGRGLFPGDLRQYGDGGQPASSRREARRRQLPVEHQPRGPRALSPQTGPGPGGQRSGDLLFKHTSYY